MSTYEELLANARQQGDTQRAAVLSQAQATNPDTFAEQMRQARTLGAPTAAVTAMPDELGARAKAQELDTATAAAPVLRKRYTDADFARLSHDEPGALSKIEQALGAVKAGWKIADTGVDLTTLNMQELQGKALSPEQAATRLRLEKEIAPLQGEMMVPRSVGYSARQGLSTLHETAKGIGYGGVAGAGLGAAGFGVGAAPGAAAGMIAGGALASGMYSYRMEAAGAWRDLSQMKDLGGSTLDPEIARGAAHAIGIVNAAIEVGSDVALAALLPGAAKIVEGAVGKKAMAGAFTSWVKQGLADPVKRSATMQALKAMLAVGSIEGAEEFFQNLVQAGGREAAQAASGKDYAPDPLSKDMAEAGQAALEAFTGTTLTFGVFAGSANYISARRQQAQDSIAKGQADGKQMADLFKAVNDSKLLTRAPDTLAQFAQSAADHHGGVKAAYIDATALSEVLQQTEMPLSALVPTVSEQDFADALASGGTIEMPIGALLAGAAGKPVEAALLPHLRTSFDGLSPTEAKEKLAEVKKLVDDHAERVLKSAENEAAARASYEVVKQSVFDQLTATGRFTPEQNKVKATLAASFAHAMGSRMGQTAEQFFAEHPFKTAASGRASDAIDQGGGLTIEGYRYGKTDRPVIMPVSYGTGLKGSGYDAIMAHPDRRVRKRVYFYADKGTGINPEAGVGGRGHKAQLRNVYDSDSDPLRLRGGTQQDFESRVIDAGYSGYLTRMGGSQSAHVIMLGDQQIKAEMLGPLGNTKGQVVPPPAQRPSLGRDVAGDTLRASKSYPAGELSRSRWGDMVKKLDPNIYEEMKAAGVFEGDERLYKGGLVADFESKTEAPDYRAFAQSVSTRTPSQKAGRGDPHMTTNLAVDFETLNTAPKFKTKLAAVVSRYVTSKKSRAGVDKQIENFITQVKDNLIWLFDQVPAETRERSKLWYEGGREIVDRWVEEYGGLYTDAQMAGALAVMSPKMAWDTNVTLAERITRIYTYQQNTAWSDEMAAVADKVAEKNAGRVDLIDSVRGKTLGELKTPLEKAFWIRFYDEAHNDRTYRLVTPEGGFTAEKAKVGGGKDATAAYGNGFGPIAKVVSILEDGSIPNISKQLGGEHKVRNFYNNIFDPTDPDSVTIDTHAAAAGLLLPLGASANEVNDLFGAAGSHDQTGLSGTYVLFAEAYRRAAKEKGVLAREMQSITWEAIRGLFNVAFKTAYAKDKVAFDKLWFDYTHGKATLDETRQAILAISKGIDEPRWVGHDPGLHEGAWSSSYTGDLLGPQRDTRTAGRGTGGNDAARSAGLDGSRDFGQTWGPTPASLSDFSKEGLADILNKDGWAVLTAEDPNATKATPEANAAAQAALKADLDAIGAEYIDAVGKYGDVQGALIVTGITGDQAEALGRKYGQESILDRRGLVYSADGHIVPAMGVDVYDTAPADFYTEVPSTGGFFSVALDWDNPTAGREQVFEQVFEQTDTPEFKEWFDDSKVVDAEGKPLVVYHGTGRGDIKEFRAPAYFTDFDQEADDYSGATYGTPGAATYPVYLSIQNPKFLGDVWDSRSDELTDHKIAQLTKQGYDGAVARDGNSGAVHWVAFNPTQIKSAIGNRGTFDANDPSILSQQTRGTFSPSTKTITLLETANLSTFEHELGHYFLDTMADVAAQPNAPADVVKDMNLILKWFGVADLATWRAMTVDQQRPHHEKLAEHFENYIFEGKAPSQELRPLFQKLREFMLSAYKSLAAFLRGHNTKLNAEVRGVFDRMIATEEEIKAAEEAAGYRPLFRSAAEAGMTDEEYQRYIDTGKTATEAAIVDMTVRSQKDLAATRRAHGKEAKALQRTLASRRREILAEVTKGVDAQPVYVAERWLKTGKVLAEDGQTLKTWHGGRKLDQTAVAEMDLPPVNLEGLTQKEGMPPDLVASAFGFSDGRALVEALINRQPRQSVIEGETDARMLEEFGELTTPAGIARAADEAVHNDNRGRALATELKMLKDANTPTEKTPRGGSVNVLVKAAKEFAANIANRTKIGKLDPRVHVAAERKAGAAAEKASAAKKPQEAIAAKRDQLLQFHTAQAMRDGAEEVRITREFFKRVLKGNDEKTVKAGRDPDVINAARAVLAAYGVGSEKAGKTANEYLKVVAQHDPDMARVLQDAVDAAEANKKPFAQLTLEEMRALREEVQVMWVLAKRSRQMEVGGDLMDREDVQNELTARLNAIGVPLVVPGETHAVTPREKALRNLKDYAAAARRTESWADTKDGDTRIGPFRKYVWQPISEGAVRYRKHKTMHLAKLRDLVKTIAPTLGRRKIKAPELGGYEFGYSSSGSAVNEIVHAILHTGNESNKRKLLLGRGWATETDGVLDTSRWDAFLERMMDEGVITKAHFDFAQGVWDLLEQTKPDAQKTHRAVFGRYFREVTADSFENRFGTYRGGYVPAQTDAAAASDAATRKLAEEENASMQYAFPATNKGFTQSRVEYNSKLLLDLNSLSQHIDKVLLFTYMEQGVRDVRRILTAKGVSQPLNRIDPSAMDNLLTPWLNRAARQVVETPASAAPGFMRMMGKVRRNVGAAIMFLNVANAAQQATGLAVATTKVKPKYLRQAAAHFIAHPMQMAQDVCAVSDYMDQRLKNEMQTVSGDISDILINPTLAQSVHNWTLRNAYVLQTLADKAFGPIVWRAAYNQAIAEGMSEADAVRLGDSLVRETQGSQLPEDVSNIETGNAFVRMFTQFTGYFNSMANLMANEFAKGQVEGGLRKGLGRAVFIAPAVVLVPAILGELISQIARGGPPGDDDGEELDDWFSAVGIGTLKYIAAMVPGAGPLLSTGVGQITDTPLDDRLSAPPAVAAVERMIAFPKKLAAAAEEGGHKSAIAVREFGSLLSVFGIIAAPAAANRIAYGIDVAADEVNPTGPVDLTRGVLTGKASPASKGQNP